MKKNILIVGDEIDPHISSVCKHLKDYDANFILLNPVNSDEGNIAYSYSPFEILFSNKHSTVNSNKIDSVWWRLKPNIRKYPTNMDEVETSNFITREWQLALEPLSYFLAHCNWINKRSSDHLIRNKPYQLYQAVTNGFTIPQSIISNNFASIIEKTKEFDEVIYKPLGYFISPPNKILFSNKMTKEELNASQQNISLTPCIFQNYIDKDFELRITIVLETVFAVKILSQENIDSKFDWRRNQFHIKYELFELDITFQQKLIRFHKSLDLIYGAYDFIVDKAGNYIFLEVNPAGQWLWLERELNVEISKQIAKTLLQIN